MGKRFALVIGMAAVGVIALGSQPAAAAPDVVKYDTKLTNIREHPTPDPDRGYHGKLLSEVRKCEERRRVVLFKRRPGADLKLGRDRSNVPPYQNAPRFGTWVVQVPQSKLDRGDRLYAKVRPKVRDRCRPDRSADHTVRKPAR